MKPAMLMAALAAALALVLWPAVGAQAAAVGECPGPGTVVTVTVTGPGAPDTVEAQPPRSSSTGPP